MQNRTYELGHEPIGRLLFKYSLPSIIAMMVSSTYNLVDAIFVGQGAGTLALAGLAVAFPIQMFVLAIAQVVGIGSSSIISRSLGAGDHRRAERMAGTSFSVVTVLSILLAIIGLVFLHPLLKIFGATENVLPYGAQFLSVIMGGCFFFAFAISTNSIVRAEGNARLAMSSMLIGAITNIVLDPIFIFGLKMGIRGAAVATVLANVCSTLFLVRYYLSGKSMLKIRWADLMPDISLLPEMFSVGMSSFTRVAAGSILAIIMNNSIAYYGSDLHLAILGIINRIMIFFMMPMFGLIQGLQPIVGFNYGARNIVRVKEAIRRASVTATIFSSVAFIIVMSVPRLVFHIFNSDPELVRQGADIIRVTILWLPFVGFQIVGASLFQALGRAWPALFLSMTRQVLFLAPLILTLPLVLGLWGIWVSIPIADGLSTGVTALWVMYEMRRLSGLSSVDVPGI
ncbi:MAG TPA: MATE family efflux transporter [Candidatus Hydrogenedentes bacterium]|nr:MATE family efflux transporter [Candidatus Hydrogenedentota bacterium]